MEKFYSVLFLISMLMAGIYVIVWHKRYSVYFTLIFLLIPLAIRGYFLTANAIIVSQAIAGLILSFSSGLFLLLFIMFAISDLCNIQSKKIVRLFLFFLSALMCLPIFAIGKTQLFYKSIELVFVNGTPSLIKEYGIFHTLYYAIIIFYLLVTIGIIIYSLIKKNDVSVKNLVILLLCQSITVILQFSKRLLKLNIELAPIGYLVSEAIFLVIIQRLSLYDISENAIDTISRDGVTGFISFDKNFTYIASNSLAKKVFPDLKEIRIDSKATKNEKINLELVSRIEDFLTDNSKDHFFKKFEEQIFQINISFLYSGKKKSGYLIYITDDTQDQKYISLMKNFNERLQSEVSQKTEHIIEMHNQFIMGMATMVESRDNSTGGHIKRTSQGVKLLIEEILKKNEFNLSEEFCKNIIKAAPMHDLGKIAVDDAILRKPGRFTDEEFEKMKLHAPEGAKIVHEILKNTEDEQFRILAENVAHYHHERWDGTGYPEGLKGEQIPLEARIMAIADVYDALVSKRVYKDSMSFENADKIIMESFGRHFDKALEPYYIAARSKLEEYYSNI